MDLMAMVLGSAVLVAGSLGIGVVVHLIGIGRIAPSAWLGLPGGRLRTDAPTYRGTHRAATPLTWLGSTIAAVAAFGSLVAALQAGAKEWAILAVLAAVVLAIGLTLATWRAHTALGDDALRDDRAAD
ncbi:hypothetical protein [Agrococcus sp. ARC_14]|uniref:hypothetical protein n=1 Tax=Agrococcus sp. ARC_14 TaxID=2919927 RepID=UPI001F0540F4|nr:hypothetical protein [Agrococcus sp. ARC_14]MCH1883708.1 hypothetical protein [Agrococcus sp. ARC_14]